jgi:hypothetical protein
MFFRKRRSASAFAGTFVVSLYLAAPAALGGSPAAEDQAWYQPIQSLSYVFGSKSTSGYFEQRSGACFVTLMITEKSDAEAPLPLSPTRARLILYPGETAGLDSEEGRSLNLTCGEAAATLLVTTGDRERLVELQNVGSLRTAAGPK